jgi:Yip1 domain
MADFAHRMIGAARLRAATYEEVEADTGATGQALSIVVISSIATGFGLSRTSTIASLVVGAVFAMLGWVIWAALTYLIGTKVLPEPQTKSDIGELLRTTGFAATPGIFHLLNRLPATGGIVAFLVSLWVVAAMIVAVRQALDYKSTVRAVGVCLIGFLIYLTILVFMSNLTAL